MAIRRVFVSPDCEIPVASFEIRLATTNVPSSVAPGSPVANSMPAVALPLIRLFTQGRKYGVACLLCTQSPRSVDYNVFGNCSTKLVGRLESAQDLERVAEWFTKEGPAPPWLAGRKGAPAGSFVGRWPQMPGEFEGRAFRSRPLFSLHEGAWSPDRLEREMAAERTSV